MCEQTTAFWEIRLTVLCGCWQQMENLNKQRISPPETPQPISVEFLRLAAKAPS
jgi:hypothetical protein